MIYYYCFFDWTVGCLLVIGQELHSNIRLLLSSITRSGRIQRMQRERQLVIQRIQAHTVATPTYRACAVPSPKPRGLEIDAISEL